jgi:A nuclease of the HNH/ENDO VII superfamily with conserved WHH
VTGGTIKFDPQAAADTENRLRQSAADISGHGDRLSAGTSGAVGRGSLGAVADGLVKKGVDIFVHGVTGVFEKLHKDTADGIKIVRERMLKAEAESSQMSKDLEATLGGVFDRGGGALAAHVGTTDAGKKIAKTDVSYPKHARVPASFFKKGGSMVEHEDGSVTYISGTGHDVTGKGKPTLVPPGTAITYNARGEPDFTGHLHPDVPSLTFPGSGFAGNRSTDFSDSNRMAIEKLRGTGKKWPLSASSQESPPGYTWHHGSDTRTMFLVSRPIHDFFKHAGGVSEVKKVLGKRKR